MQRPSVVRLMATVFVAMCVIAPAAIAGTRSRIEPNVFAPLHAPVKAGVPIRIAHVPLVEEDETIVLEEFSVLAPGAVIEVTDAKGNRHPFTPTPMRQFRGSVVGDPQSIVYLSITKGTRMEGFVMSRDHRFSIWSAAAGRPVLRERDEATDIYIEEASEVDMSGPGFTCDVENMKINATPRGLPKSLAANELNVRPNTAPTGTQKTVLNLAIVADDELYANFSSNSTNEDTFLRNLVGAQSTIYMRDLSTEIRISYELMNTGGPGTDPFVVVPGAAGTWNGNAVTFSSLHAVLEFGDYWHNTPPSALPRSAAALIAGKSSKTGIAWIQQACSGTDFPCSGGNCGGTDPNGHFAGAYSYNGGIGTSLSERTVPDPNANPNYNASTNYWPLYELSHEFGHNVQSLHTHCTTLSPADQATYGRTYVDNCYTNEGGCYSGATSLPADGAGNKGTIMSYCHLNAGNGGVGAGGSGQMRFTLGQAGEASHTIIDAMRAQLDVITPSGLSAITAPSTVPPGIGGQAASVTNTAGLTFDWTITNGTFTGGGTTATGASVTFTGVTDPVTLKVYATKTSTGCAITDSKSVTVIASGPSAPTNLVATASTASSVTVTWNTVTGATAGYNVYRSTDNTIFTLAGNTAGPPFINNTGLSANTAYMYKVRATNGVESTDSNKDFAVTVVFTDTPLVIQSTKVKAAHFTELRTAVNALRTLNAGQAAFSFTDGTLNTTIPVKAVHLTELRTQLNTVRTALGFSTITFAENITATSTTIKKSHLDELRTGVQ